MKPFTYSAPATLDEATALLGSQWGETEVLAGGTDLVTALKQGITTPSRLVSLKNIKSLRGIKATKDALEIGSMTTLAELVAHKGVQQHFPSLVTAAQGIGSSQILNVGTVGGDLCQRPRCWYFRNGFGLYGKDEGVGLVRSGDNRYHAIFNTDGQALFVSASSLGPALLALGATVVVTGPKGNERKIAAGEFFIIPSRGDQRETSLKPNEVVVKVVVPIKGLKNATYEVRHRHGLDWPYVTASVACQVGKDGRISDARVALGHVSPKPYWATEAAKALEGAPASPETAAKCGEAATKGAKPLSKNAYKIQLVKTAVKRAVQAAAC